MSILDGFIFVLFPQKIFSPNILHTSLCTLILTS